MPRGKGPQFTRFFLPILEVLRLSGGSGTVSEVIDSVIERMKIPESEQAVTLNTGQSRIRNQVQWARLYLVRAAYLDASRRGIWSLTEKGLTEDLSRFDVLASFKNVQKIFQEEKKQETKEGTLVEYLPSYLVLGTFPAAGFHVLFAADVEGDNVRIITAYRPDLDEWESDLRTRRGKP